MNDLQVCWWPIDRPRDYPNNARKWGAQAIEKVAASLKAYGFRQPVVVDRDEVIIIGHLRRAAGRVAGFTEIPVHVAEDLTPAQVRGLRLMDNRSHQESDWDLELLGSELEELRCLDFDLSLTGFDDSEIDEFLLDSGDDERADQVPPLPEHPAARLGDVWRLGDHRLICGDCTQPEVVAALLGTVKPLLMVTDPPYGISLDTEWRDRAGLNGAPVRGRPRTAADKRAARKSPLYKSTPAYMRTEGHREVSISGDTIADWSHAFELVPSLQVAYVWHASVHTVEVVNGLLRIGFLYPQQIIWNKGRPVLTRTHYWFAHEPAWYVRKKNAPWYGAQGSANTTIWEAKSPKFIMGGSKDVGDNKQDHPTQKPVELMRKPILNHTKRGGIVYDPFLGSGTTLIAAELSERACYGMELDPKYVDVICQRYIEFSGKPVTLEATGQSFEQVKAQRPGVTA